MACLFINPKWCSGRLPSEGAAGSGGVKHALSGYWSRRITDEQRVVYKVQGDVLLHAERQSVSPDLQLQAGHAREIADVGGDHGQPVGDAGGGEPKVVGADERAGLTQLGP